MSTRVFFLALLLLLPRCAVTPPVRETLPPAEESLPEAPPPPPDPRIATADRQRERARGFERKEQAAAAVESWQAVAALNPGDKEAAQRIGELRTQLSSSSEDHFRKGKAYLEEKKIPQARREFIKALSQDSGHEGALDYLKNRLLTDSFIYEVREGDTLEGIAGEKLGDEASAVLIARLNDLDGKTPLRSGLRLTIPVREATPPAAPAPAAPSPPAEEAAEKIEEYGAEETPVEEREPESETILARARSLYDEGDYDGAIDEARGVDEDDPAGEAAQELINAAYFGLGRDLEAQKKYIEALEAYLQVDPGYGEIEKAMTTLTRRMQRIAEEHYITGVQFFVNERIDDAVREWEKTLDLYPEHPKAAGDITKARKLAEKLRNVR